MKRLGIAALAVLVLALALGAVLAVRAAFLESKQLDVPAAPPVAMDVEMAARRLGAAVAIRTLSPQDPAALDRAAFLAFHAHLAEAYPRTHAKLGREVVGDLSLLYTWPGSDPAAKPILVLAHMDVVPVEPGTEAGWHVPPFEGRVAEGFVWGRGSMDDKGSLVGALEAVELLLAAGFVPRRTIYLAFGHDEEVGGVSGAAKIAALLASRGVKAELTIDEGLAIADGMLPGLAAPVALVGIAEKGYLTIELAVATEGGHSSMPPRETSVGILAGAVARVEANQPGASLEGPAERLFEWIGPEMGFARKLAFANLWLFGPVLRSVLSGSPVTNALVRTTTAPTMLEGSVKENVLAARARALVNFRIRPGETMASVTEHVKRVVADERVTVTPDLAGGSEPTPVSSTESAGFALVHRTIREVFPGVLVAPGLVTASTDSKHYAAVAENSYRFVPLWLRVEDRARFHGTDERVSVENFAQIVRFYVQLMRNAGI